jgi:cytochrome b561
MKNTETRYGWVIVGVHWVSAVTIFGLFGLGFWMVELSYYDLWYKKGPDLHKSVGLSLLILTLFRLIWKLYQTPPEPVKTHTQFERKIGGLTHLMLYGLLFLIMFSGYLISTADERGISFFGWFEVPGFGSLIENQEDVAGLIHQWLAYALIALALLHAAAALKHHFIDKDNTLKRMLGRR